MRFRPLLSLSVEHGYFADGRAHGLSLRPDGATAKRLGARWFAWRADEGQLAIAADADDPPPGDDLQQAFRFLAWPIRTTLAAASEPFLFAGKQVLRLSTDAKVQEADGRWRLHTGETASADDLADPAPDAEAHPAVPARRPLFDVSLTPPAADAPLACVIRLASRKVFWTYLVQGASDRGALSVVDAGGTHTFEALGEAPLPGARTAQAFRSAQPLALAERPPYRFQLREQGSLAERVLIRRLPGAGQRLRPVPGRDGTALQAEIFVHV